MIGFHIRTLVVYISFGMVRSLPLASHAFMCSSCKNSPLVLHTQYHSFVLFPPPSSFVFVYGPLNSAQILRRANSTACLP